MVTNILIVLVPVLAGIVGIPFLLINRKLDKIMAAIDDLNKKVDELQATLDAEQEQILKAIADLEQQVKDLEAIVASGGGGTSDAEIQAVIDKIDATITDLKGTIPDEPAPEQQKGK